MFHLHQFTWLKEIQYSVYFLKIELLDSSLFIPPLKRLSSFPLPTNKKIFHQPITPLNYLTSINLSVLISPQKAVQNWYRPLRSRNGYPVYVVWTANRNIFVIFFVEWYSIFTRWDGVFKFKKKRLINVYAKPKFFQKPTYLTKGKIPVYLTKLETLSVFPIFYQYFPSTKPKICIKYRPIQISSKINSSQVSSAILIQMKENVIKHFVDFLSGSAAP